MGNKSVEPLLKRNRRGLALRPMGHVYYDRIYTAYPPKIEAHPVNPVSEKPIVGVFMYTVWMFSEPIHTFLEKVKPEDQPTFLRSGVQYTRWLSEDPKLSSGFMPSMSVHQATNWRYEKYTVRMKIMTNQSYVIPTEYHQEPNDKVFTNKVIQHAREFIILPGKIKVNRVTNENGIKTYYVEHSSKDIHLTVATYSDPGDCIEGYCKKATVVATPAQLRLSLGMDYLLPYRQVYQGAYQTLPAPEPPIKTMATRINLATRVIQRKALKKRKRRSRQARINASREARKQEYERILQARSRQTQYPVPIHYYHRPTKKEKVKIFLQTTIDDLKSQLSRFRGSRRHMSQINPAW